MANDKQTGPGAVVFAAIAGFGVLAVIVLAIIVYGQSSALREQAAELRSLATETGRLAALAERQAETIAKVTGFADDSLKTMKGQARAYLAIRPGAVLHVSAPDNPLEANPLEANIQLVNDGQTAAARIQSSMGVALSAEDDPSLAALGPTELEVLDLPINPAGDIDVARQYRRPLTAEEAEKITAGGPLKIYVFGSVKYQDVFGDSWTEAFCFKYAGQGVEWPGLGHGYRGEEAQACTRH